MFALFESNAHRCPQSTSSRVIILYESQFNRRTIYVDPGGLMKLFNQFNILPKYLTAFNYAGLNLNETPKELEKCTPEFQNFWEKECREHPTNQNCLIYCD